ncbi:MAG: FeoA domain-containing protein, partial [Muribaculaceae bacterium]|nr:FeoA domain-containing protein [Muribaculaceae bacterium]
MRLSDLKTGETAVVVKILGHGAFRKRMIEMGFVRGRRITALLSAPLRDPVKYTLMGYEVSLRCSEASLIEVVPEEECSDSNERTNTGHDCVTDCDTRKSQGRFFGESHTINVALIGNPNCGKTSLFNVASGAKEHVGNYSGVTIDAKEGYVKYRGYRINIVDLPGTYSLS